MRDPNQQRLVTSRFLAVLPVARGWSLCSHAILGRRHFYDDDAVRWIASFAEPATVAEAIDRYLETQASHLDADELGDYVDRLVSDLVDRGFLLDAAIAEEEAERLAERLAPRLDGDKLNLLLYAEIEDHFGVPGVTETYAEAPARGDLRFLLLGWCGTQSVREAVATEGRARGWTIATEVGFTDDLHLVESFGPDVVLLETGHRPLLAPVFDAPADIDPAALNDRISTFADEVARLVAALCERCKGVVLVQGIASPQTEPAGVASVWSETSLRQRARRLDAAVAQAAERYDNAVYVDEEGLLSAYGKRWLIDDTTAPYSHHTCQIGDFAPTRHRLLAASWLDALERYQGRDAIRLIVVDLDDTLWPGRIAEPDFRFDSERMLDALLFGAHGGLQQALQALRGRGILLAVVSKNEREPTLATWSAAMHGELGAAEHLLKPDDFVLIEIGWRNKSEVVAELALELGVPLSATAFIDDHPVERAEVAHALPEVWVLGEDIGATRATLLSSPRLQPRVSTAEGRRRTESTRARVERDRAASAAPDRAAFLKSLEVRCRLRAGLDGERLRRITELLARTTQFRTTHDLTSSTELEHFASRPGSEVWTLQVSDRFADYGLVGVALVEPGRVACYALSCRVIGTDVHDVLFRRALERARGTVPVDVTVDFTATDRNAPARRLFTAAGFERLEGGAYRLPAAAQLPPLPSHCALL